MSWRSKLREAELAFKNSRLDRAAQLIHAEKLDQHRPGQRLSAEVANALAQRAETHAERGELETGWRDLELAQSLVGETERLMTARSTLFQFEFSELERLLSAEDSHLALNRIDELHGRGAGMQRLDLFRDVALKLANAKGLFREGRFSEADEQLDSADALIPGMQFIQQRRDAHQQKTEKCRQLTVELHRSMSAGDWSASLALADELIGIVPDYQIAINARKRAWDEAGRSGKPAETSAADAPSRDAGAVTQSVEHDAADGKSAASRFLMWVDGVGGYLVCLGSEIIIGQAAPDNDADVPIQGDLASHHAKIRREQEGYVLEPLDEVRIGGRPFRETTFLSDGDVIDMRGVRLRFRKPHVLSASVRLEFVSRHRTYPWSDAILLMAESCVLGPHLQNHVVCRDWRDDVMLFRQDGDLYCRSLERIEIDGQVCEERGKVTASSRIEGEDFAISLEEIC